MSYAKRNRKFKEQKIKEINVKNKLNSIKILISKNKISKALSEIEELLEKNPNNSFFLFQHANILYILGEYNQAKEEFQNIIDLNLDSKYTAMYKLGNIALSENNINKAKDIFMRNILESPYEEVFSAIALSKIEMDKGNLDKSLEILNKFTNTDNDRVVLQRALILRNQYKFEEAYELLNSHHFNSDKYILGDYCYVKACLESDLRLYDKASISFNNILKGEKNNLYYKTLVEHSIFNYKIGNYQQAISSCLEIINSRYDKYHHKTKITLGNIYKKCGKLDFAKKSYFESINNDSNNIMGYLCLCDLAMIEKNYDKAKEYANKYIENSNNNRQKNSGNLRLALIAMKTKNLMNVEKL